MSALSLKDYLAEGIKILNLVEFNIDADSLLQYIELLYKWNKVYNLTAIDERQQMVTRHLLDSLAVLPFIHKNRLIDVGSGAGLPGIPLAIVLPDHEFVLLDSNHKKTRFLTHVANTLKLANITVVTERAEQYHPEVCFDIVITRAFSDVTTMLLQTRHLCCANGSFFAMQGKRPDIELTSLPSDIKLDHIHSLAIPYLTEQRHLAVFRIEH